MLKIGVKLQIIPPMLNMNRYHCRLVIDTTVFAFLLSVNADALLSIFSIDYRIFYAF